MLVEVVEWSVGEVVNCGKRPHDGASEGGGNDPGDAETEHGRLLSFDSRFSMTVPFNIHSPCN